MIDIIIDGPHFRFSNHMDWTAIGTISLAIVTGVLAFLTWRSIKQNSEINKKERKERLLKEIINWGESIKKAVSYPT